MRLVSLLSATAVAATLLVAPSIANAAPATTAIANERIAFSGTTPKKVKRGIALQKYIGGDWRTVKKGSTTKRGAYAIDISAGTRSGKYRVVTRSGTRYVSPTRAIRIVAQRGTITASASTLTSAFTPVRAGRAVALQALTPSGWVHVASSVQDAAGRSSFAVSPVTDTTYRAVASPHNSAGAAATDVIMLGAVPPPPAPVTSPSPSSTPTTTPQGTSPWVTGYYAGWFWDWAYPPEAVDMSAMTHFVFGRVAPGGGSMADTPAQRTPGNVVNAAGTSQDPGLSPDGESSVEDYLIDRAHDAGTKALLMLGGDGADGIGYQLSTADGVRPTFVENIVDYLVAHDYDGVDIDWENCLSGSAWEMRECPVTSETEAQRRLKALIVEIRAQAASRPRYATTPVLITFPGYNVKINDDTKGLAERWQADVANLVDQYNLMSYGIGSTWAGGGWDSWFSSAMGGQYGAAPVDLPSSIEAYEKMGVPRSRMGIGIGFYGIYYGPNIQEPRMNLDTENIYQTDDVALRYEHLVDAGYIDHGVLKWDEAAHSTYRSYPGGYVPAIDPNAEPAGMLSYEDERSIAYKGKWVRDTGVGGTIIWMINYGYQHELGSNPLLTAVKHSFLD